MMRIALVTPGYPPEVGGVEFYVQHLAVELNALGLAVDVLTQCPRGRAAEWTASETSSGIRVLRFGDWTGTRRFRIAPGLWHYLRQNGDAYDVIHVHSFHASAALAACQATNQPIVFTPYYHGVGHTLLARILHLLYDKLATKIFTRSSYVLCLSDAEAKIVSSDYPECVSRVRKVGAGIDVEGIRQTLPFEVDRPIVLILGRLEVYKHIDRAIEAFAMCNCDADMVIIGSGPERSHIISLVNELGVGSRVRILGYVDDAEARRWQRTATVVMSLSAFEAFGLVVAEAAVAGARVVASDIPAHREVAAMAGSSFELVDVGLKNIEVASVLRRALLAPRLPVADCTFPTWHEVGVRVSEFYQEIESASQSQT
jgi:glycosyltransferase involved in cell wall biosynthesis